MNDLSEIENQLKQLRPVAPSASLMERIKRGLAEPATVVSPISRRRWTWKLAQNPYNVGLGLAGAAALALIFARFNLEQRTREQAPTIASVSPSTTPNFANTGARLVPVGFTQVVYNTRDEGLHFPAGSGEPMRRLRTQKRETLQWHNSATGASLRISYPSEEVSLIPVTGE
jgi:hypothetical protein